MSETIVVVGAGVSGLTTAMLLSRDEANTVTVVAKHMPGDYDSEYASPFAGANVMPMANEKDCHFEAQTWHELKRLAGEIPEAGIHFQRCTIYRPVTGEGPSTVSRKMGTFAPNPWWSTLFDDYRELASHELLPGCSSACEFTGVCINTPMYLAWLVGQLRKNGGQIKRAVLADINEAKHLSHTGEPATLIINATGLGSLKLGGVADDLMVPARGQVVVVRNELDGMILAPTNDETSDTETLYGMQRAAGGGTILGGTFQRGNWNSQPDPETALRIMTRAVKARPDLAGGKGITGLSIIRHAVGLRPYRDGGVRIEKERLHDGTWVVHNYGHGGWGYQGSYGCASAVLDLVGDIKRERTAKS